MSLANPRRDVKRKHGMSNSPPTTKHESPPAERAAGSGLIGQLLAGLLVIGMAALAGLSVDRAGWAEMTLPVVQLAALAAVFGLVLAKTPLPDAMAHLVAIGSGVALTLYLTLRQVVPSGDQTGWLARLQELGRASVSWYLGDDLDNLLEAQLITFLMATILWLVGYLAAWCLFRRGWVFATIILPGFLILVNLGFANTPSPRILTAYGLIALLLLVRQNLVERQERWRRRGMTSTGHLGNRSLFWGSLLAVAATLVAVAAPATVSQATFQPLMEDIGQRASSVQQSAAEFLERVTGSSGNGQVPVSGSFSSFGDSFAIGGPLELSNTPQVLVSADRAPYLTAQTLDAYTGRGWYSTVEETFVPEGADGRRYSPEMTFWPNQDVPLSPDVMDARTSQAVEVTLLAPFGNQLFTVDTYQTSSVESLVRMSWRQLDGDVFALTNADDLETLPRELRAIGRALLAGTFTVSDEGNPVADDAELQEAIDVGQSELASRFLDVTWTVGEDGRVTSLVVSGQLPVYDDVEAVSARTSLDVGESYRVISATSEASAEDLALAGTDYPEWVAQRYLTLPDTVTSRTIERALEVTEGYDNPYDKAKALEQFIRSTMIYDENVTAPPEDADIVDYLLFERQRGYCEYSASAMTVMLRAIGIPARVVVGYAPGTYDGERAGFVYLQSDAHAWTEVFFPGYGWIPFEPTPSESVRDEPGTGLDESLPDQAETPASEIPTEPAATPNLDESLLSPTETAPDSTPAIPALVEADGNGGFSVPWVPLILLAGVATVAGLGWFLWSYPLRHLGPGSAFYVRLRRLGAMMGVHSSDTATPREFGRAFAERAPGARRQIEQIVKTYEIDQFGPAPADERWLRGAAQAWQSIRRQLPAWLLPWRDKSGEGE